MESKSPWLSKTLWLNLVMAVLPFVAPPAKVLLEQNPEVFGVIVTGVNFLLRLITKQPIAIS